jgi:hypothetical protein
MIDDGSSGSTSSMSLMSSVGSPTLTSSQGSSSTPTSSQGSTGFFSIDDDDDYYSIDDNEYISEPAEPEHEEEAKMSSDVDPDDAKFEAVVNTLVETTASDTSTSSKCENPELLIEFVPQSFKTQQGKSNTSILNKKLSDILKNKDPHYIISIFRALDNILHPSSSSAKLSSSSSGILSTDESTPNKLVDKFNEIVVLLHSNDNTRFIIFLLNFINSPPINGLIFSSVVGVFSISTIIELIISKAILAETHLDSPSPDKIAEKIIIDMVELKKEEINTEIDKARAKGKDLKAIEKAIDKIKKETGYDNLGDEIIKNLSELFKQINTLLIQPDIDSNKQLYKSFLKFDISQSYLKIMLYGDVLKAGDNITVRSWIEYSSAVTQCNNTITSKQQFLTTYPDATCYMCDCRLSAEPNLECEHMVPLFASIRFFCLYTQNANAPHYALEYEWAHKCCNGVKSNNNLIIFDKTEGKYVFNNIVATQLIEDICKKTTNEVSSGRCNFAEFKMFLDCLKFKCQDKPTMLHKLRNRMLPIISMMNELLDIERSKINEISENDVKSEIYSTVVLLRAFSYILNNRSEDFLYDMLCGGKTKHASFNYFMSQYKQQSFQIVKDSNILNPLIQFFTDNESNMNLIISKAIILIELSFDSQQYSIVKTNSRRGEQPSEINETVVFDKQKIIDLLQIILLINLNHIFIRMCDLSTNTAKTEFTFNGLLKKLNVEFGSTPEFSKLYGYMMSLCLYNMNTTASEIGVANKKNSVLLHEQPLKKAVKSDKGTLLALSSKEVSSEDTFDSETEVVHVLADESYRNFIEKNSNLSDVISQCNAVLVSYKDSRSIVERQGKKYGGTKAEERNLKQSTLANSTLFSREKERNQLRKYAREEQIKKTRGIQEIENRFSTKLIGIIDKICQKTEIPQKREILQRSFSQPTQSSRPSRLLRRTVSESDAYTPENIDRRNIIFGRVYKNFMNNANKMEIIYEKTPTVMKFKEKHSLSLELTCMIFFYILKLQQNGINITPESPDSFLELMVKNPDMTPEQVYDNILLKFSPSTKVGGGKKKSIKRKRNNKKKRTIRKNKNNKKKSVRRRSNKSRSK